MCGRTSVFVPLDTLEERFEATHLAPETYEPRYNISPGQPLEVITNESPNSIDRFHWGLLPPWADEVDDGLINARAETASDKRPFASAWEKRPCLVLSTGFYEWQSANGGPKTPYRIYRGDDEAFAMAGLWQTTTIAGEDLSSVTILTTEPNELLEPIHDRMPVVLPEDAEAEWLEAAPDRRKSLCRPYPHDDLDAYEISTQVNDPANDRPEIIEPASTQQSDLGEFSA